jgi:hypothetical protein
MPRIDDYHMALDIAKNELSSRNPHHVCRVSGALWVEEGGSRGIRLRFLNKMITVSWPNCQFYQDSTEEIPIKEKILILHYLNGSNREHLSGQLIAFQDIPSARFYLDAFNRRVKYPMVNAFDDQPDQLPAVAKELFGATTASAGDISVLIQALPKIPVILVIWRGDEEFPSDGTILFDSSIKEMLSAEDVSELTSRIVYPLIARAS